MENYLKSKYRTHTCQELRSNQVGQKVILSGWVSRIRDHGGVIFVDLRDHYGITQVILTGQAASMAEQLRIETVIQIEGEVVLRGEGLKNAKLLTGEIEVRADQLTIHSSADVLPFQVSEDDQAPENIRLKYRFLELRREKLHRNIMLRLDVIKSMRELMAQRNFNEFHTPILTSSSPEGARDFIVPSRMHPGKFYALPQAPQQFKQLLMVAGFDRYFQIAPCFRDEDSRADRSPGEFYQIDLEMSFVEQEQVLQTMEGFFIELFKKHSNKDIQTLPFQRIKYADSLSKYGTDKPDLRVDLEIKDVTSAFANTSFRVFQNILAQGGKVKAIAVTVKEAPSRKFFDDLVGEFTKATGLGLGYLIYEAAGVRGSFQKLVTEAEVQEISKSLNVQGTTVVFLAAGKESEILPHLGRLRVKLGQELNHLDDSKWAFCWITEFPFYEINSETGALDFGHNPFSMPQGGLEALNTQEPLTIRANQYDLVLNGYELGSGAIRNHKPEVMYRAFELVGYKPEVVDEKFGGMIKAFKFGAPPHGGCAFGVERIVMLLSGESAIREVIAFPLAQNGEDLLMSAPSTVSEKQLREAHIQLRPIGKEALK